MGDLTGTDASVKMKSKQFDIELFGLMIDNNFNVSVKEESQMAVVERSVPIKAPVAKIFEYWNDPENLTDLWPSMTEVKDVEKLENGRTRFKFTFKFAGISIQATSADTEYVVNDYVVNETIGGIKSTMKVEFRSSGQETDVSIRNEYQIPIPLIGKLAEAAVLKGNEEEVEAVLNNLKIKLEN